MIWNDIIQVSAFCPFIKTEETIFNQIRIQDFSNEYEIMPYPLAHWINTIGIDKTNHIVKNILKSDKIRVFVCQHILVDKIQFDSKDLVFTPHSTIYDNFISIPHFSVNYDDRLISQNKKYKFSFIGSIETNKIRKSLVNLYPENCFTSGENWGLDKRLPNIFRDKYINLLGNSTFSICPRGTGISSVRLFESMAMNSIPIIIANGYKKPLSDFINWDDFSITVDEEKISEIVDILETYDSNKIENMRKILSEVYNEFFCNENLSAVIKKKLKK